MRNSKSNVPYSHVQTQVQQTGPQKPEKPDGSYDYTSWENPIWQDLPEIKLPEAKLLDKTVWKPTPMGEQVKLGDLGIKVLQTRDASTLDPTPQDLKHEFLYTVAIDLSITNGGKAAVQLQPEGGRFLITLLDRNGRAGNVLRPINESLREFDRMLARTNGSAGTILFPGPESAVPYNDLPPFVDPGKTVYGTLLFQFQTIGVSQAGIPSPWNSNGKHYALAVVENGVPENAVYAWGLMDVGTLKFTATGSDRYQEPPYPVNSQTYPGEGGVRIGPNWRMIPDAPSPKPALAKDLQQQIQQWQKLFPPGIVDKFAQTNAQSVLGTGKVSVTPPSGKRVVALDVRNVQKDTLAKVSIPGLMDVQAGPMNTQGVGWLCNVSITNKTNQPLPLDPDNFAVTLKGAGKNNEDIFAFADDAQTAMTDNGYANPGSPIPYDTLLPLGMPWRTIAPGQTVTGAMVFPIYRSLSSPDIPSPTASQWDLLVISQPVNPDHSAADPSSFSFSVLGDWKHSD